MLPEQWLIDGYNVLRNPGARSGSKPPARDVFFARVAGFAAAGPRRVLIVMDGIGPDDEWGAFQTASFSVVYSQKVTADSYIERFLCENKGACAFTVVTGDRAVVAMARGAGARVLDASEFLALIGESGRDNEARVLKDRIRSHGFNRPFGDKLK
ncbi:MAG TPA: NYN domain-containing protein [Candidatus Eisenbacteria bacterium]|jgi:predicted RNA-binding protein with PIN domain|nr:NYN domain-containing protein [Candidatus Eisenbacteria bacterium]